MLRLLFKSSKVAPTGSAPSTNHASTAFSPSQGRSGFNFFSAMPEVILLLILSYSGKDMAFFFQMARIFDKNPNFYAIRLLTLAMNASPPVVLSFFKRIEQPRIALELTSGIEMHNSHSWNKISTIQFLTQSGNMYLLREMIKLMPGLCSEILAQIKSVKEPLQAFKTFLHTSRICNDLSIQYPSATKEEMETNLLLLGAAQQDLPRCMLLWICYKTNILKFLKDTPLPKFLPGKSLTLANGSSLKELMPQLGTTLVLLRSYSGARAHNPKTKKDIGKKWVKNPFTDEPNLSSEYFYYYTISIVLNGMLDEIVRSLEISINSMSSPAPKLFAPRC